MGATAAGVAAARAVAIRLKGVGSLFTPFSEEAAMRLTQLTSLVLFGLLVSGSAVEAGRLRIPVRVQGEKALAKAQQQTHTWVVSGFGVKESEAMQDGLHRARETILSYLADQGVYLKWDLPERYIEKHMVKIWKPAEDKDVGV